MRILALFLSFFPLIAQSAVKPPEPVVGEFQFAGTYRVESVQRNEVVNDLSEEGKKKLEALQSDGFTCVYKAGNWWACAKHIGTPSDREELDLRVRDRFRGSKVVFEEPRSELKLEFNTDFYKQWVTDQKAVLDGEPTYRARYAWTQGVWKVYLVRREEGENPMFLMEDGRVAMPVTIQIGSERSWDRYFLVADFR